MRFDVIFTDEADDTFDSIGSQVLQKWGERELFKFRARVYDIVDIISKSPFIFQAVDDTGNLRKVVIHRNCSMLYEVGKSRIMIILFWDNRQNPIFI